MKNNPIPYLSDIIESCDRIITNVSSMSIEAFREDLNLQDAVIRRFEIIGEAVKRVPEEVKLKYPEIPWKYAAGFRDILIHDYSEVVIDQVYITGADDLPAFKEQIQKVLKDFSPVS